MSNDINFILFHKGPIPDYFSICVKQIETTQTNYKLHILTDQHYSKPPHTVHTINNNLKELINIPYYAGDPNPLWRTSFERFFYIRDYIINNNLNDIVHFDSDVLIYKNVYNILSILQEYIEHIGLTPHKVNELVCGFMFIKHKTSLNILCEKLLTYAKYGESHLQNILNSMPHEMRLLGEIKNTTSLITELPVSPINPGNNLFEKFNIVFDPSSYGQHIGGTHSGNGTDKETVYLLSRERYIDKHIGNNDNNLKPYFDKITKTPFVKYMDSNIPIFNLHIHSKHLYQYV